MRWGLWCAACIAVLAIWALPLAVHACGGSNPCAVEGGYYLVRLPPGASAERPAGAIIYFHGHRSSAEATMRFKSLTAAADALGVALIAPHGQGDSWSFPNAPRRDRDEISFVERVLDDALARFPIDPARLMSAGFSIGGSMSWYMTCHLGERFAGHTPVSGTFWRPHPAECRGPDPFISHVHGTTDKIFPMTGRVIRKTFRQGDTNEAVAFFRERHGHSPVIEQYRDGNLDCTNAATANGGAVELCLHGGGHSIRGEWVKRGWLRLAAFKGWDGFAQTATGAR